jgi:hypothetical protein
VAHEPRWCSQSNEDEIISDIFRAIGTTNKRFCEFGCADGNVNNTVRLLLQGWSGDWFDLRKKCITTAKERWAKYPVNITWRKITADKVNLVVKDPLDFLSIDLDGHASDGEDYWVWAAIKARPRVVCIESVTDHPYDALAESKGYKFFAKSASEVNSFYVLKSCGL